MSAAASPLIHVAALCGMLLEALEKLDDEIASEALIRDLREMCDRARRELSLRVGDSGA